MHGNDSLTLFNPYLLNAVTKGLCAGAGIAGSLSKRCKANAASFLFSRPGETCNFNLCQLKFFWVLDLLHRG